MKYPLLFVIIIASSFAVFFFKSKNSSHENKRKVANTEFIKNSELYVRLVKKYKRYIYVVLAALFVSILASACLSARIVSTDENSSEVYDRDIMLCLDVSGSMYSLDNEIVKSYLEIVQNMHGERFGLTIFDSSAFVLVPLTEDYDYVEDVLKKVSASLEENEKISDNFEDYDYDLMKYIYDGTMEGEGSSVIGDGFATCVMSFPKLNEDRSRILILATDNSVAGPQIITVAEASKLAQKYKISVYPLSPYDDDYEEIVELRNVAKETGGTFYGLEDVSSTKNIISSIEKKEKTKRETSPMTITKDHPTFFFVVLLISVACLFSIMELVKI